LRVACCVLRLKISMPILDSLSASVDFIFLAQIRLTPLLRLAEPRVKQSAK